MASGNAFLVDLNTMYPVFSTHTCASAEAFVQYAANDAVPPSGGYGIDAIA